MLCRFTDVNAPIGRESGAAEDWGEALEGTGRAGSRTAKWRGWSLVGLGTFPPLQCI